MLKAALHGVHREKAALAEQVLQKSLELQQAKAAGGVPAEASNASEQVPFAYSTFHSMQNMLAHGSMYALNSIWVCVSEIDITIVEQLFLRTFIAMKAYRDDAKLPTCN